MRCDHTLLAQGDIEAQLRELTDGDLPTVVFDAIGSAAGRCPKLAGSWVRDSPHRNGVVLCAETCYGAHGAPDAKRPSEPTSPE